MKEQQAQPGIKNAVAAGRTEPSENCALILSHPFTKSVLVEIRTFSESWALISGRGWGGGGGTDVEIMTTFSTGAKELSR